jgi:hypothetical protein
MNEKKPAIKEPGVSAFIFAFGIISMLGGAISLIAGFSDGVASYFMIGVSALTTGAVLVGFSAGLELLTRIVNYLAVLASKEEPQKPDSIKEAAPIQQEHGEKPTVYKI